MSDTAHLMNVTTESPRTQLNANITRLWPVDGADLTNVDDTIAFSPNLGYIKINNTEKMEYADISTDFGSIAFENIKRGAKADFQIGFYCGDGVDPRINIPQLNAMVGPENPIYSVTNYQAATETGMSSYPWYDWLYERGMWLQLAFEPKNPAKDFDDQAEWALNTYVGGSHDADFDRWAASIVAFCSANDYVIYIRPMSEMNGDWTTWGAGVYAGNTPANYRAAWQHLWGRMEAGGANDYLKWIWCPVAPLSSTDAASCWTDYYPGDAYVDIIGMNGYNFGAVTWSFWRSFEEIFSYGYNEFTEQSAKDLFICEIGCNSTGGNKPLWIEDAWYWLQSGSYNRFVGASWFNMKEPSDDTINYMFNESPYTTRAYKAGAFFRRNCQWCGTSSCMHRVAHANNSEILGLGNNPTTPKPIEEKKGTISLDGDILTNVPIDGNLWMYFEDRSYVEDNVWVFVALPKVTQSRDLFEGDILTYNLVEMPMGVSGPMGGDIMGGGKDYSIW